MLVAIAVPGLDADAVELALLRAGHHVAWRAIDDEELLTQLADRAPDAVLIADHPAVATATVVGSCDLVGVRTLVVAAEGIQISVGAQRLGLHDVLRLGADGTVDLAALTRGPGSAPSTWSTAPPVPSMPTSSPMPPMPVLPMPVPPMPRAPTPSVPPTLAESPTPPAVPAHRIPSLPTDATTPGPAQPGTASHGPAGQIIAVWGPAGAPGRTTLAIGLAAELAARGLAVCLIDADTYGGTVAPALGLLDESPGFAAACRLAGTDSLTALELDRVSQRAPSGSGAPFSVLTGIGRPHRWPELSTARVSSVLEQCRRWRQVVIVDAGFSLETDEEVSSDLLAPRRNAATIAALRAADQVVAVGSADPLGLARLLRTHADLLETVETAHVRIAINRVRASVLGIDPHGQVRQSLERFAGIRDAVLIDDDRDAADAALLAARPVPLAAPRSALSRGVAELADALGYARGPATSAGPRWAARLRRRRTG